LETKGADVSRLIVVRADWDQDASVWVAASDDLPGLVTEAESVEALLAKLPGLIIDLLVEDDGDREIDVPVEVIAQVRQRVRTSRAAI
jgi:predicted RNase H-like HicB family nuclease